MKYKESNTTRIFSEYLKYAIENKGEFNTNNITMACYASLNEIDTNHNIAEVVFNMQSDFEFILNVIETIAKDIDKQQKIDSPNHKSSFEGNDYFTIPEIALNYNITEQAIRKACKEGRLNYKKGFGKNKYLITKQDIKQYMASAKGKNLSSAS